MLNFNSPEAKEAFTDTVHNIPENVEVYLIGGSVRNALYRQLHGKVLTQRDYDQVVNVNSAGYLKYLRSVGFSLGNIDRPTQKIYAKNLVEHPVPDSYVDSLVFDIHTLDGMDIVDSLRFHSGFTINGFAIAIRDALEPAWTDKLIALPGSMEDMENKKLRLNYDGYKEQTSNLFAAIRFMSVGFEPPPNEEVEALLAEQVKTESDRYQKGIEKVYKYVGGELQARELAAELHLPVDIFDEAAVRSYTA